MSDRELLEWAAKAAGVELDYTVRPDGKAFYHSELNALAAADGGWFSPLTDDGDALRLFAKMPFCTLYVSEISVTVNLPRPEGRMLGLNEYAEDHGGDMSAAIRLAIVRAAASIGQSQEDGR